MEFKGNNIFTIFNIPCFFSVAFDTQHDKERALLLMPAQHSRYEETHKLPKICKNQAKVVHYDYLFSTFWGVFFFVYVFFIIIFYYFNYTLQYYHKK